MTPYVVMFLLPSLIALVAPPVNKQRRDGTRKARFDLLWVLLIVALMLVIGLRYRVGGDWGAYFLYLQVAVDMSLRDALLLDDPGYRLLNGLSVILGLGIVGVNAMSGLIFAIGLMVFARSLPRPWLAVAVAVPYMVIVVAMGYTRQSVALGFVMMALVAQGRGHWVRFVILVLLGATFHKTAVMILPLVALTVARNRWMVWSLVAVSGALGYQVLLGESAERLLRTYVEAGLQSTGAQNRLTINAIPAVLFLVYRKRLRIADAEYRLWFLVSLLSLAMFGAYFATSASTALDRMALYLLPLQLFVAAHLPDLIGRRGKQNQPIVALILAFYAALLFGWLNLGTMARAWLPYQMALTTEVPF